MRIFIIILVAVALLVGANFLFGSIFGWIGVIGVTTIFTAICLFYFYRTMKLLSAIQSMPEGKTAHIEYLYKNIAIGMPLIKIIQIAQALGKKVNTTPLTYTWEDGQNLLTITFQNDKALDIKLSQLE